MSRIVLTNQDLSGQTIEGQPFSYIGRCTGRRVRFVGDWTHVSHFANTFIRPDWSRAKTRHSYSRFNTFRHAITSPDIEYLDHDMMVAALEEGFGPTTGNVRWGLAQVIVGLRGKYMASWSNLSPPFLEAMGGDVAKALASVRVFMGGRDHLIQQYAKLATADASVAMWHADEEPHIFRWGVEANNWGVVAKSLDGRNYRKQWLELPVPKNPHDRAELEGLIEADVEKAVGFPVTIHVRSILPWRAMATYGTQPRDWWVQ